MAVIFISAIDTDAGKTVATGLLARAFMQQGYKTITVKIAQTGCENISDDIAVHRQLMGLDMLPEDKSGLTCPFLFKLPASPHLAARLESRKIETDKIVSAINKLNKAYDVVLVEGVGGLMVPITEDVLVADFVLQQCFPMVLITSSKLGSINHSLLSVELCKTKGLNLIGMIYNAFPAENAEIVEDSEQMIKRYTSGVFPKAIWDTIPQLPSLNTDTHLNVLVDMPEKLLKSCE